VVVECGSTLVLTASSLPRNFPSFFSWRILQSAGVVIPSKLCVPSSGRPPSENEMVVVVLGTSLTIRLANHR
jgi:hypothetical protein